MERFPSVYAYAPNHDTYALLHARRIASIDDGAPVLLKLDRLGDELEYPLCRTRPLQSVKNAARGGQHLEILRTY